MQAASLHCDGGAREYMPVEERLLRLPPPTVLEDVSKVTDVSHEYRPRKANCAQGQTSVQFCLHI
jgi:hypothetical protein